MSLHRRILKIPCAAKVRNVKVLRVMKNYVELNIIKVGELQYVDHIMRNRGRYDLLQRILHTRKDEEEPEDAEYRSGILEHGLTKYSQNFLASPKRTS